MAAHRTRPATCIVVGCTHRADTPGTGHGLCAMHYSRRKRHGLCQALVASCDRPATSHIGLCDLHVPDGVPA